MKTYFYKTILEPAEEGGYTAYVPKLLSAEMLFRLATALKVSSDEILDVGNGKSDIEEPSLKIVKRLKKIERLPLGKQKALLTNIDMFLKAAESG